MLRLQQLTRILQPAQAYHTFSVRTLATMSTSVPAKMRAIQIMKQGGLDVIEEREVDVPELHSGETLVKVEYAGVNFIDTYRRSGLYKIESFPHTLGQEAAGTVVQLADDVKGKGIEAGDKVAAYIGSAFAEYVAVPRSSLAKLDKQFDTRVGAAALLQGLTGACPGCGGARCKD